MKTYSFNKCIFTLIIIFLTIGLVIAQNNTFGETTVTFGEAGTITPEDGFLHTLETWWEDVTNVPEHEQIIERYAEAYILLNDEDYESVEIALSEAVESHEALHDKIENLAETTIGEADDTSITSLQTEGSALHTLVETEQTILELDNQLEVIESTLIEAVESGVLQENHEVLDSYNSIESVSIETQTIIEEEKKQAVGIISEETGVSELEAEIIIGIIEDKEGVTEEYNKDVTHESITSLEAAAKQIEQEIKELEAEGEDTTAAEKLLAQADLHLARAEIAL